MMSSVQSKVQVFDKPMCCSTGVCGPRVDPVLPQFAADLAWLKDQGVEVERFNLAQQPQEFVAHADVQAALREGPDEALPLVRVNGRIVSRGIYPTRDQLSVWCQLKAHSLPQQPDSGSCGCGPKGCC
jgi:hypothetical protein